MFSMIDHTPRLPGVNGGVIPTLTWRNRDQDCLPSAQPPDDGDVVRSSIEGVPGWQIEVHLPLQDPGGVVDEQGLAIEHGRSGPHLEVALNAWRPPELLH